MESSIRLQTNDQQTVPKYYEPAFFLTSVHSNDFSHQVFPSLQTLASHVYCYGNDWNVEKSNVHLLASNFLDVQGDGEYDVKEK